VLDHEWSPLSSLFLDDYEAGRQAARYFYERGHRHCGLCWKEGHRPFYFRAQGYIDELKRLSSGSDPFQFRELKLPAGPEEASSELIFTFLKDATPQEALPLALFCANDSMAMAVRRIALDLGCQIPQDLSLIGFDDSPLVRIKEIDLTSFRYPSRYLGGRAVELLFDQIANRALNPQVTIKITPPLVERTSVRTIERDTAPAKEHP
jgi:GntR family transcriptional regulator of arabinose operon